MYIAVWRPNTPVASVRNCEVTYKRPISGRLYWRKKWTKTTPNKNQYESPSLSKLLLNSAQCMFSYAILTTCVWIRQLEQRHAEQLRLVQEVAQADRDQLVSQLQRDLDKRKQQIQQLKEEESRLKESAISMTEVCCHAINNSSPVSSNCCKTGFSVCLLFFRITPDWQRKTPTSQRSWQAQRGLMAGWCKSLTESRW